jgi:hypothetical protein
MLLGFIPVLLGAFVGIIVGPFYHGFVAGLEVWKTISDEDENSQENND